MGAVAWNGPVKREQWCLLVLERLKYCFLLDGVFEGLEKGGVIAVQGVADLTQGVSVLVDYEGGMFI